MDREPLSVTAARMSARRWALLLLPSAALLLYCEARQEPEGHLAKAPPFRVVASAAVSKAPLPSATFSLSDFRPLLTAPELAKVAAAIDSGAAALAAQELELWLAKSPPPEEQRFRYDFLQARLYEQAGQWPAALRAYGRVSAGNSSLQDYARVGEARALLGLGRSKEVAARLASVPDAEPIARAKWPVLAEAARLSGDQATAIIAYERVIATLAPGSERAEAELRLANALLDSAPAPGDARTAALLRALALSRRVQNEANAARAALAQARVLEARALELLPDPERNQRRVPDSSEQLEHVHALFDARHFSEAALAAEQSLTELTSAEKHGPVACELQLSLGRAASAKRAYKQAAEVFDGLLAECSDPDLRARAEFIAGKAAASDNQHVLAVKRFAELEQEAPHNSLADDARLYAALSYLELGVEARFTELLSALPDDYPDGDMVVEGAFRLALRRFDKQDFQGAARVLERVLDNKFSTGARAADFAGRERYFHARALAALGESERANLEYEALIGDVPFSYYMLSAYSELSAKDPARARAALASALARVPNTDVVLVNRPEFSGPGFARALELFGVGDLEDGTRELDALGLADSSRPEILWGLSKLYAEAGSVKLSHAAARRALSASPSSYPGGAWLDAWKLAYPAPYHEIVQREAKRTAEPEALIYAIMREESAFDPDAESSADAYGLMQLIVPTAKSMARPLGLPYDRSALKQPRVNVALGASVLAKLRQAFPENALLTIAAYNAGPGNPARWLRERPNADFDLWVELIPFVETRRYMKRVLASRATYAFLYEPSSFEGFALLPRKIQ